MATTADIRNGLCIKHNEKLFQIIEFQHVKPGKGPAFVRTKMRQIESGKVLDHTFSAGHKIEPVRIENREYQYLYQEGSEFVFMNNETFEQVSVSSDVIGDQAVYLQENMTCVLSMFDGRCVAIQLPARVTLEIVDTEPTVKGQTASSSYKPATLSNGARTMVPPHITAGTRVVIMTEDGSYVERAKD